MLGQLYIFEKKKKKLEQTRQNKPQKGKLLEQNRRALLRLFRARFRKSPCFPTKEPGIEKLTIQINACIHVTLALCLDCGRLRYGRQFRE